MKTYVEDDFLPQIGRKPSTARWTDKDSLFSTRSSSIQLILVTWIGINDINRGLDIDRQLALLFDVEETLYNAGARNFIFFTVPPFHRSPLGCISVVGANDRQAQ